MLVLNGDMIYNFKSRTERFKTSPIVFAIDKYNYALLMAQFLVVDLFLPQYLIVVNIK
jgi:hypothetical protein